METIVLRSIINKYFPKELYVELYKVTLAYKLNNNKRGMLVKELLKKYNVPVSNLGNGTNRIGFLLDGYAVKIALDEDGMVDNRREMLYSKDLYPDCVKVYECCTSGLIAVFEYVTIFTLSDYSECQDQMRDILERVSNRFLIGDVGISSKNFVNWGRRSDGSICMLDFAYCYAIKYKLFTCTCGGVLVYDKDYVGLRCVQCGKTHTFWDIRKKVTRKCQEEEIGDIRRLSYVVTKPEQEVEKNLDFEPVLISKEKTISPEKAELKRARKQEKRMKEIIKSQTDF